MSAKVAGYTALVLIGLASAMWMGAEGLRPQIRVVERPFELQRNTSVSIPFRAQRDGVHDIGIEFDQGAAETLVPCMANLSYSRHPDCRSYELPFLIKSQLTSENRQVHIEPNLSRSGGRRIGRESFIWILGYVQLKRGELYVLDVRSEIDATALSSARPRLTIEADRIAAKYEIFQSVVIRLVALILAGVAAIFTIRALISISKSQSESTNE